ncbi:MAG: D-alanyl-D-alanine carboxypeptidase family protein [Okeania sp. SIO2F4]|uniref:M15 family metallopeptidase n=1 Tax=Okeania sp. SIO2F4 TaxID=2607790 RepID=UPI00142B560A|nr:D-alanyl-D-alanine carboxypeptidase family protein [Okeania sp. SIO2F4]NES01379.1 D-alanyl-D-alanine carboxypeptidase family protein [Okeania sp. SIO2F4]
MNNESLSENLSLVQETLVDEIPEAVRDPQKDEEIIPTQPNNKKWIWSWMGIVVLVGVVTLGLQVQSNLNQVNASSSQTETDSIKVANSSGTETPIIEPKKNSLVDWPYSQIAEMELAYIVADSDIRLQINAAKKFQEMLYAARNDGVNLVALRGFQSKSELETLVSNTNTIEANSTEAFSPLSYGEYITGYAVDIGDENAPETYQNVAFENTAAFQWLKNNAAYFSFEMIPVDNEKGVGYEPWHWRYVGDRHSLETFYKNLPNIISEEPELIEENPELSSGE